MESIILGIETSCDETAASVVKNGNTILSNIVSSQIDIHKEFGGIVPELAGRHHLENIRPVIELAAREAGITLDEVDAIAVTTGPGLIGSLLIGLSVAKALSYGLGKPLLEVNHLEGHLFAIFLEKKPPFPFVALVVSGGHTDLYLVRDFGNVETLGRTRDDAAGECFDKVGRIMGLGYPGGPIINRLAAKGDPQKIVFPRPMLSNRSSDFSFSGLKTSVKSWVATHPLKESTEEGQTICDLAASFQEAVVDVLVSKALAAAERHGVKAIVASGGVACNSRLREQLSMAGSKKGIQVYIPDKGLCTDNAAMIAAAGHLKKIRGENGWEKEKLFSIDASAN